MGDLDARISDAVDLYSDNFSLNFDASLFRAVGVSEGAFLGTAGATYFGYAGIDNATGSGSLAHIQLEAIGIGSGAFSFSDLLFLDSAVNELAVTVDAQAEVPEPASYALFGIGLFGAAALRRRKLTMHG